MPHRSRFQLAARTRSLHSGRFIRHFSGANHCTTYLFESFETSTQFRHVRQFCHSASFSRRHSNNIFDGKAWKLAKKSNKKTNDNVHGLVGLNSKFCQLSIMIMIILEMDENGRNFINSPPFFRRNYDCVLTSKSFIKKIPDIVHSLLCSDSKFEQIPLRATIFQKF